jgi:hypothetical protein
MASIPMTLLPKRELCALAIQQACSFQLNMSPFEGWKEII